MMVRSLLACLMTASLLQAAASKPRKEKPDQAYEQAFNQGYSLQKKSDYFGAIEKYSEAISLKSDYAEAYNNRAYCYKMVAKDYLKLSGDSYKKALSLKPDFVSALEYQGTYYIMTGELKNAYKNYQALLRLDPDEAKELKKELDPVLDQAEAVLKEMKR